MAIKPAGEPTHEGTHPPGLSALERARRWLRISCASSTCCCCCCCGGGGGSAPPPPPLLSSPPAPWPCFACCLPPTPDAFSVMAVAEAASCSKRLAWSRMVRRWASCSCALLWARFTPPGPPEGCCCWCAPDSSVPLSEQLQRQMEGQGGGTVM